MARTVARTVAYTPVRFTASQLTARPNAPAGLPSSPPPPSPGVSLSVSAGGAKSLLVSHITPCSRVPLKGSRPCNTWSVRLELGSGVVRMRLGC
jgi:hypothetical protein